MKELRVKDFLPLIGDCSVALDGGAGAGDTARAMLAGRVEKVEAFEPFPGNHRFFEQDERIVLHKSALGNASGTARFEVPSVVGTGVPGWEGREGYSSVGYIKKWKLGDLKRLGKNQVLKVPVVRADDVVEHADFIKLDLQGGEVAALRGMKRLIETAKVLWVEFTGDFGILDELDGFDLYTTELVFSKWSDWHDANLEKTRTKPASIGVPFHFAWHGPWVDFRRDFKALRAQGLIQTDIVAVRKLPAACQELVF